MRRRAGSVSAGGRGRAARAARVLLPAAAAALLAGAPARGGALYAATELDTAAFVQFRRVWELGEAYTNTPPGWVLTPAERQAFIDWAKATARAGLHPVAEDDARLVGVGSHWAYEYGGAGRTPHAAASAERGSQEVSAVLTGEPDDPARRYVLHCAFTFASNVSNRVGFEYGGTVHRESVECAPGGTTTVSRAFDPGWASENKHWVGYGFPECRLTRLDQQQEHRPDPVVPDRVADPLTGKPADLAASTASNANRADPVNAINGSVNFSVTDLALPTPGPALRFARSYNSVLAGSAGALGAGWSHVYEESLADDRTVFGGATNDWTVFTAGSGSRIAFPRLADGTYGPPAGLDLRLTACAGGWELAEPGRLVREFDPAGRLAALRDAWGNRVDLLYDPARPGRGPVEARHSAGPALAFAYDEADRLVSVAFGDALAARFAHGGGAVTQAVVEAEGAAAAESYAYAAAEAGGCLTQRVTRTGTVLCWTYAPGAGGAPPRAVAAGTADGARYGLALAAGGARDTRITCETAGAAGPVRESLAVEPVRRLLEGTDRDVAGAALPGTTLRHTFDDAGNRAGTLLQHLPNGAWLEEASTFDTAHRRLTYGVGYKAPPPAVWQFAYDPATGELVAATDPAGTLFERDLTNGLPAAVRVLGPDGTADTAAAAYDAQGRATAMRGADGLGVSLEYGSWAAPARIAPDGQPDTLLRRDGLGRVVEIEQPGPVTGRVTRLARDGLGRLERVERPDGREATWSRDAFGRVVTNVDAAGRATAFEYELGTHLRAVRTTLGDGAGAVPVGVGFAYDPQMNLASVSDPLGRVAESYAYDGQFRLARAVDLEGRTAGVAYVVGALPGRVRRFDGTEVTFGYDAGARLSEAVFPDETVTAAYASNGLPLAVTGRAGAVSNRYDGIGRLVETSRPGPGAPLGYAFGPGGRLAGRTGPGGPVAYAYDAAGRPASVQAPPGLFTRAYNGWNGALASAETPGGLRVDIGYDVMDRPVSLAWSHPGGYARSIARRHDAAGRLAGCTRTGPGGEAEEDTFEYDTLDRLVGWRRERAGRTEAEAQYTYDLAGNPSSRRANGLSVVFRRGAGNRLAGWDALPASLTMDVAGSSSEPVGTDPRFGALWVEVNGRRHPLSAEGTNFWAAGIPIDSLGTQQVVVAVRDAAGNTARATNEVFWTAPTNAVYASDAAGCLTNAVFTGPGLSERLDLEWDGQYRLRAALTNGVAAERCEYGPLGRRLWIEDGSGARRWLVYDGPHVVAELDDAGALLCSYVYGPGIDERLAMTVYAGGVTSTYAYVYDALGSVHALVDAAGREVERYAYDPWGRVLGAWDADGRPLRDPAAMGPTRGWYSALGNRYLWQGREYSWSTGLYSFRARWYDPLTGRWLSPDPIGINGGLNLYVFCGNSPVNFRDPWGLCEDGGGFWSTFGSEWCRASYGIALSMGTSLADAANWVGSQFGGQRLNFSGSYGDAQSQLSLRSPGETQQQAFERIYNQMYGNNRLAIKAADVLGIAGTLQGMASAGIYRAAVVDATAQADVWILQNIAADKIGGNSAQALANVAARRAAVRSSTSAAIKGGARGLARGWVAGQIYDSIAWLNAWARSQ